MCENNFCANLYLFLRDVESLSLTSTYASQFDRFIFVSGELTSKWPKFQQICSDGKRWENNFCWKRNFDIICLTLACKCKFVESLQGVTYSMVCALNCRSYSCSTGPVYMGLPVKSKLFSVILHYRYLSTKLLSSACNTKQPCSTKMILTVIAIRLDVSGPIAVWNIL